jgi:hypothetical protein
MAEIFAARPSFCVSTSARESDENNEGQRKNSGGEDVLHAIARLDQGISPAINGTKESFTRTVMASPRFAPI